MNSDTRVRADSSSTRDEYTERQREYNEMLEKLDLAADQCIYKISGEGRITDAKKEQARTKWINSLVRVVKERRQILEQRELEQLEEQIEQLKEQQERGR